MKKCFVGIVVALACMACSHEQLTILHTNDTHSRVEPTKLNQGGYARRMGMIARERERDPELLLLDAGDFCQGTPYFNYFHGRVEIDAMNWMGYDAATLGNHEFDYGVDTLAAMLREAQFPIVCANYDVSGSALEGLVRPFVILERKGLKIGVFGLGCNPYSMITEENFRPLRYLEPYAVAQQMADTLRQQGCNVVVCLSHMGTITRRGDDACDSAMVAQTRGIDVVIGGHTHELHEQLRVANMDGDSIPLCQMEKNGVYLGEIVLDLYGKTAK